MIISVPTIYSCKISTGWLNLAQARQLEVDDINPLLIRIVWSNGHSQTFIEPEDTKAIIEAWREASKKYAVEEER